MKVSFAERFGRNSMLGRLAAKKEES